MVLATVLISKGFGYTLERLNSRKAVWRFDCPPEREEEFDDLIDAYEQHSVRVEPRSFLEEYAQIRKELYKLLDSNPVRRPFTPSASADGTPV